MKKIRIGNDIVLRITVTRLGAEEDFTGKTLTLTAQSALTKVQLDFVRIGNVLTATWLGTQQTKTGTYRITLQEDYDEASRNTVDECCAFALVAHSCECTDAVTGSQQIDTTLDVGTTTTDIDLDVSVPGNGLSAYELAVKHGYEGTESEWLASLKSEAQTSIVMFFDGYVESPSLMTGTAESPDFVAYDEQRQTFVAGKKQTNGSVLYYPSFDAYGSFTSDAYGTATDNGIRPTRQKMYFDTESATLCVYDGTELRQTAEAITNDELEEIVKE